MKISVLRQIFGDFGKNIDNAEKIPLLSKHLKAISDLFRMTFFQTSIFYSQSKIQVDYISVLDFFKHP